MKSNSAATDGEHTRIAIVGIAGLFPGSLDASAFWNHILNKSDLISEVPGDTHWKLSDYFDKDPKAPDKTYATRGGFLPKVPFEPMKEGIPPNLLASTDTSQLLGLLVARTALDEAFGFWHGKRFQDADKAQKERVSCILGVTSGQELFGQMASRLRQPEWRAGMRAAGIDEDAVERAVKLIGDTMVPWTEASFPGLLGNVVAGRIANRLDIGGTNAVTDAACASSFAALSMGVDELMRKRSDVVLCGGVDTLNDIFMHMCFSKTPALSANGECRPFDEAADGTLLGEGLGMVALKRLDDAERDGNVIYAVIRGIGTSSDGKSKSVYAPVSEGQAKALKRAYAEAGYSPRTVELVEAHGTGTKAGDLAELKGLNLAFDEAAGGDKQWCALGSVKSQIGHTKAAAGAAGLIKAALALHEKVLPPTIKVTKPNPAAAFENSAFYVANHARPWVRAADHPRRAGVSSFGFGGSNFHVTLEEYTGPHQPERMTRLPAVVVAVSGADAKGAAQQRASKDAAVADFAKDSHNRFVAAAPFRAAFVASTIDEINSRLDDIAHNRAHPQLFVHHGAPLTADAVALVFPGQGSQSVMMGADLAIHFPAARRALDRAASAAPEVLTRMLPPTAFGDAAQQAQVAALTATEVAQPALGIASMASLAVLRELGVSFAMACGHSFGELSALCAAGAMSEETLYRLARARGELMRDAAVGTSGAMAAVFASAQTVREHIASTGAVVANDNAPDQVVISGTTEAIQTAIDRLQTAGVRCKPLNVATAFHSPVVAGAVAPFAKVLAEAELAPTRTPVFACSTAQPHGDVDTMRRALAEQIEQPVRFVEDIQAMHARGATVFIEVGAGQVLRGLVKRILPNDVVTTSTDSTKAMLLTVAQLTALGLPLALAALPAAQASRAPAVTSTSILLTGSNSGKPTPPAPAQPTRAPVAPAPVVRTAAVPVAARAMPAPTTPPAPAQRQRPQFTSSNLPSKSVPMTQQANSFFDVLMDGQRATAEAHLAFQRTLAESHANYLASVEATHQAFVAAMTGQAMQPAMPRALPNFAPTTAPTVAMPTLPAAPQRVAAPIAIATSTPVAAPAVKAPSRTTIATSVAPIASTPAKASNGHAVDARTLLLDVVADKTGYPKDALLDDMNLEADLGIDSIKRVEILGALKDKLPSANTMDALKLAQLRTLGEIATALGGAAPSRAATTTAPSTTAPKTNGTSNQDVFGTLLDVVADKTGYPKDALNATMALESDLGVDSIKRVEILSALKEKLPNLPQVDAVRMAQLSTLGDIAGALSGGAPASF